MTSKQVDYTTAEEFLEALRPIFKEYGLIFGSCGCCNSPFIIVPDDEPKEYAEEQTIDGFITHCLEELKENQ